MHRAPLPGRHSAQILSDRKDDLMQCSPLKFLLAGFWLLLTALPVQAAPPNIVLILSDDQAWNDYSALGHPQIKTPHIDRLFRESLTFTRGYVPDSLCRPSLSTIITGRFPHQHGIVGNDPPVSVELRQVPRGRLMTHPGYIAIRERYIQHIDDEATLPKLLAPLGYLSQQTGKWWEGHYSRGGFTHGMTHGNPEQGGRHGDVGLQIGRQGLQPIREFLDLATAQQRPFFLWYAPMLPHTPHNPPQRLLEKYTSLTPHLPVAKYWAMCEWFDETVGELLQELQQRQLNDNTIVVYVCDNGWINSETASDYTPRSKRSQYEGGIRTPISIRWPGHVQPRLDEQHLASSIDLVPTLLSALGQPVPEGLPGINLLDQQAVENRRAIFGEIFEHDIRHMTDPVASLRFRWVIDGPWKLIVPHRPVEPEAEIELFNLAADPDEQMNLAMAHPDRVAQLRAQIDAWWAVPEAE
jgi:uncharacterized sulfatase